MLDNLEQIPAVGPALAELLAASPRLAILATSRAPLHLMGEQIYPVPPLALPTRRTTVGGASELPPLDALARTEAVRLFVERAAAASGDFELTEGNAAAVAAICERVNGLPLAIELAAARSRVLMPAELLARLSPQLPLLAGGPADQPPRLRSMAMPSPGPMISSPPPSSGSSAVSPSSSGASLWRPRSTSGAQR